MMPIQHVIVKGCLCTFPNALQATCPDESNPHSLGVMLEGVYQLVCGTFIKIAHDIYLQVVIPPVHRHSEARRHDHAFPYLGVVMLFASPFASTVPADLKTKGIESNQ
jgi:hypothetical protein